jgi:hypothetical protein
VSITGTEVSVATTGNFVGITVAGGGAPQAEKRREIRRRKDKLCFIGDCASIAQHSL